MIGKKRARRFVGMQDGAKVAKLNNTLFWAERGLIRAEDEKTGRYEIIGVRSFLIRAKALSEMNMNSSSRRDSGPDRQMREIINDFLSDVTVVVKQAQEQGMPSDASARRDLVRRRVRTVWMGGSQMV